MFTIGATIPIAVFMGFYMFKWRKGQIKEATIIGVTLMLSAVVFGKNVAESSIGALLRADAASDHRSRWASTRSSPSVHAGVDAADAARVSQHLHEDRDDSVSRPRRHRRQSDARGAGILAVRRRRRPDHSRPAVPVRVHHDRLRRDLRLPCADRIGHDVEDGRQGNATSARSATWRCCSKGSSASWRSSPPRRFIPATISPSTRPPAVVRDARHADGQPRGSSGAGRRERHRPHRRRRVARRRHGADLLRTSRACAA